MPALVALLLTLLHFGTTTAALSAETIWVPAGTRLWSSPERTAHEVARVDIELELAITSRRPHWVLVRYRDREGWIPVDAAGKPVPSSAHSGTRAGADPERLRAARSLLLTEHRLQVGDWTLYTDVDDAQLLRWLDRIPTALPDSYRRRFHLEPSSRATQAIVLYRRDASLERFLGTSRAGVPGGTGNGVAALARGERSVPEVARVLVHELTHLLNRRVFEQSLPWWLEEGMATDLAFSRLRRNGDIRLGTWGGTQSTKPAVRYRSGGWLGSGERVQQHGPVAALTRLQASLAGGEALRVGELLRLQPQRLLAHDSRPEHYIRSACLVRFLLDGSDPALRRRFLDYLERLATESAAIELLPALHLSERQLNRRLHEWITSLRLLPRAPDPERTEDGAPPRPSPPPADGVEPRAAGRE